MSPPARPLCPVIPNNACTIRLNAAAGTDLAGASSGSASTLRVINPKGLELPDSALQPEGLHRTRGVAPSRFPALVEDSRLQPPVGVWAVSQSQCGRTPSQAG